MTATAPLSIADVLATFKARREAIVSRDVPAHGKVLIWPSNGLCVRMTDSAGTSSATGFEHATVFTSIYDAPHVRNGHGERAALYPVEKARVIALDFLDKSIATVEAMG